MVWCDCLTSTSTEKVTQCLVKWFQDFGFPKSIRTDGGPQFRGPFDQWCEDNSIIHELSSAYNPQSNGHAENGVKTAKHLLAKVDANMRQFYSHLFSWRNTPRADGFAPADLFFGRRLRSTLPSIRPAACNVQLASEKREKASALAKTAFDLHARPLPALQPGDPVAVQNATTGLWGEEATVVSCRPDGLSYEIKYSNDATSTRSRKHLRARQLVLFGDV